MTPFHPTGTRVRCVSNASEGENPRYLVGETYPVDKHIADRVIIVLPGGEIAEGPAHEFETVGEGEV